MGGVEVDLIDIKGMHDKALQELDEISDDPNIPSFTRTQIWNIVSILSMMDK